jgi:hypothetical protein
VAEQPRYDGAEQLAGRALAVVEHCWQRRQSALRLACPSSSWPEASAGRRVLRRRANNDGVHALLVAAVVTKNRPEASEHLRDRTAALEADVFRFLPRDAHRAAPLPFIAAGAPRSCRRRDRHVSLSSGSTACQGQTSPSPYGRRSECKKTGAAGLFTERSRGWGGTAAKQPRISAAPQATLRLAAEHR